MRKRDDYISLKHMPDYSHEAYNMDINILRTTVILEIPALIIGLEKLPTDNHK